MRMITAITAAVALTLTGFALAGGLLQIRPPRYGKQGAGSFRLWTHLCVAYAIVNSYQDQVDKEGGGFKKLVGPQYGRLVRVGAANRNAISIWARKGRVHEARRLMLDVATRHGYLLRFDDGDEHDPRKGDNPARR